LYQFRFLKNGLTGFVGARGPERDAPEASADFSLGHEDKRLSPPEEAGRIFPAPTTEISAPYDSKRPGLVPGLWKHWACTTNLFSKDYSVTFLLFFNFHFAICTLQYFFCFMPSASLYFLDRAPNSPQGFLFTDNF
jgi:hypothetical protein